MNSPTPKSIQKRMLSLLVCAVMPLGASCAAPPVTAHVDTSNKLQGVYTHSFTNGNVDGSKYKSTNSLEILKLSQTTAYFKTHLEWANGHECNLSGIADVEADGSLMYRESAPPAVKFDGIKPDGSIAYHELPGSRMCVLTIKPTRTGVVLGEEANPNDEHAVAGVCREMSCGARGSYDGVEFHNSERTPINEDKIKRSPDFQEVVEKYSRQQK